MHPFIADALAGCPEIRALWSIDHEPEETSVARGHFKLLAFADAATLLRLRKRPKAGPELELFVVVDGDSFEAVWSRGKATGSLARWAWRQTSPHEAYYDEARWAPCGNAGAVIRVRRKALLLWQASVVDPATARRSVASRDLRSVILQKSV